MLTDTLCSERIVEKNEMACDVGIPRIAGGLRLSALAGNGAEDLGRSIDAAAQDLADAIAEALPGANRKWIAAFVRVLSAAAGLERLYSQPRRSHHG